MSEESKVINKIKKLFSLAGNNPNQEEAKQAMLKAQQLMSQYGVSVDMNEAEVIEYGVERAVTKMNKAFRLQLSNIIARNFRCKVIIINNTIAFFGRKDDAKICKEVFEFAYKAAKKAGDAEYKRCKDLGHETKNVFNSYCLGFNRGLSSALDAQCTALAIIVPPDVHSEFKVAFPTCITSKKAMLFDTHAGINDESYNKGNVDGSRIMQKRAIE